MIAVSIQSVSSQSVSSEPTRLKMVDKTNIAVGSEDRTSRSAARTWLMRCLAIMLGLAPLALLEAGLRCFAPPVSGAVDPILDLQQLRPLFVLDESTDRWSIPPHRLGFFRPASFAASKPSGTRRIFVLGGSTVQGRPYSTETAFSSWLRLRLESAEPETDFEVINCGGVSYASYRVAKILDEVLQHDPDLIVLYTGHNEFLEDRTYADVRSMSPANKVIWRIGSHLRTVQWLKNRLATHRRTRLEGEVDARLDHIHGLESYQRDPDWQRGVQAHFALTLQRMVDSARHKRTPIILCAPASELVETPPFKVEPAPLLSDSGAVSFDAAWSTARDPTVDVPERLRACQSCLAIDPQHAGAHYIAGRLHFQQGRSQRAREHLNAAKDHDVCALRATSAMVDSVHQIAVANSIPLVDTVGLFDQRDAAGNRIPDGVADPESFVDHVHPTIAGHQLIALAIAQQIEELGWIDLSDAAAERYQRRAREYLATLGEAYYGRGKQRLAGLRRWAAGRAGDLGAP